ncbi:Bifunctional protein GlmU [Porphyridium purpureum]|uniref:UDP-N-acetylglucosamine diphosphorylase n=1 Tax=Porphyridium purpureum TaxID=35688 RepID=A0A5J4Z4N6_PORPP|nr:Bifunctional protein GlmU [Porphyridium purpureum]|eukprot:POR1624..scf295_1
MQELTLEEFAAASVANTDGVVSKLNEAHVVARFQERAIRTGKVGVCLAAGQGSRFISDTPKVLHAFRGKALVLHAVDAVLDAGIPLVLVVGVAMDQVMECVSRHVENKFDKGLEGRVVFVHQPRPLGTGHAVYMASEVLPKEFPGDVIVVYADNPGVDSNLLNALAKFHDTGKKTSKLSASILSGSRAAVGLGAANYGRLVRCPKSEHERQKVSEDAAAQDSQLRHRVLDIVERKYIDSLPDEKGFVVTYEYTSPGLQRAGSKRKIESVSFSKQDLLELDEFNSGIVLAQAKIYFEVLAHVRAAQTKKDPPKFEFYATDFVKGMVARGLIVDAWKIDDALLWRLEGANTVEELAELETRFKCKEAICE